MPDRERRVLKSLPLAKEIYAKRRGREFSDSPGVGSKIPPIPVSRLSRNNSRVISKGAGVNVPPSIPIKGKDVEEMPGRRVGRNPTPGVPRRVGPMETSEGRGPMSREERKSMTKSVLDMDNPKRIAMARRLAAHSKKKS